MAKQYTQVSFTLPPEHIAFISDWAQRCKMTKSEFLRLIIQRVKEETEAKKGEKSK